MTGFGRHEFTAGDKLLLVEIKSLNGKQLELNLRLPAILKPYEFEIRNILGNHLLRGSVDCFITLKKTGNAKPVQINTDLLKAYFLQMQTLAAELQINTNDVLPALLKLPEVLVPTADTLSKEEWQQIEAGLLQALSQIKEHRATEGEALWKDLCGRINNIVTYSKPLGEFATQRINKQREIIKEKLAQFVPEAEVDHNRLEQELIYYIEKIDITEEQTRLAQHCKYFFDIEAAKDMGKGKKIGFILQEIGREINTTGSKAYDADIQKIVVQMKDELEKAKEQALNIL
jgi:uncharacterized protein (TIGR00255 family)